MEFDSTNNEFILDTHNCMYKYSNYIGQLIFSPSSCFDFYF